MPDAAVHLKTKGLGQTRRKDAWWTEPTAIFIALVAFIIYATWAAFQNGHYRAPAGVDHPPYISPFYAPDLTTIIPGWTWSPAFLILWIPAGFRLTCYFCRRCYYRGLMADPPGCAVGEPRGTGYRGETGFWAFNNLHRYFLYFALILVCFHWIDVWHALHYEGKLGIGVGTVVIAADAFCLTMYVFSCHALRHLVGGGLDAFSTAPAGSLRLSLWRFVTRLNEHHGLWFWISLFVVGLADVYVRCVSMGLIRDLNTWGVG